MALVWLIVAGCLGFVVLSFGLALSAFYHPASDAAGYAAAYTSVSAASVILSLIMAIVLTEKRKTLKKETLLLFPIGFVAILAILLVCIRVLSQPPDYFRQYLGDTAYAVPRVYGASSPTAPNGPRSLLANFCFKMQIPQYAGNCRREKGIPGNVRAVLSKNSITSDFDTYRALDGAGIRYDTDKIEFVPDNDKIVRITAGGFEGLNFLNGKHFVFWNENNEIQFWVSCRSTAYCLVTSPTPHGNLQFPSEGPAIVDLERWWLDEPTCDGQFKNADPE